MICVNYLPTKNLLIINNDYSLLKLKAIFQELYSYKRKKRKRRKKPKVIAYESFTSESESIQAPPETQKFIKTKPVKRKKSFVKRLAILFKNDKTTRKSTTTKKRILSPVKCAPSQIPEPVQHCTGGYQDNCGQHFNIAGGQIQPFCSCRQPITVAETRMKTLKPGSLDDSESFDIVSVCQCGCPIERTPDKTLHYYYGCPSPTPQITDVSVCECGSKVNPSYFSSNESVCSCTESSVEVPCETCKQSRRRSSVLYGSGDLISGSRVGESVERHAGSPDLSSEVILSVSRAGPGCWPRKRKPRITVRRQPITKVRRRSGTITRTSNPSKSTLLVGKRTGLANKGHKPKVIYDFSSDSNSEVSLLSGNKRGAKPKTVTGCFGNNTKPTTLITDSDSSLTAVSDLSDQDMTVNPKSQRLVDEEKLDTVSFCKCKYQSGTSPLCAVTSVHEKCVKSANEIPKHQLKKQNFVNFCCSKVPESESNTSSLIETAILNNDTTICKDCKISAKSDQDVSFCKCHKRYQAVFNSKPNGSFGSMPLMQHPRFIPPHPCMRPDLFNRHFGGCNSGPSAIHPQQYPAKCGPKISENSSAHLTQPLGEFASTTLIECSTTQHSPKSDNSGDQEDNPPDQTVSVSCITASIENTVPNPKNNQVLPQAAEVKGITDQPAKESGGNSLSSLIKADNQVTHQPSNTAHQVIKDSFVVPVPPIKTNQPNPIGFGKTLTLPSGLHSATLTRHLKANQPVIELGETIINQSECVADSIITSPAVIVGEQKVTNQPGNSNHQSMVHQQISIEQPATLMRTGSSSNSFQQQDQQQDQEQDHQYQEQQQLEPVLWNRNSPVKLMCRFCSNHTPTPDSADLLCELCMVMSRQTPDSCVSVEQSNIPTTPKNLSVMSRSQEFESPTWLRERGSLSSPQPNFVNISPTSEQTQQKPPPCEILPIVSSSSGQSANTIADDQICKIVPIATRAASPIYCKDFSRRGSPMLLPSIDEGIQRQYPTSPLSETTSVTSLTKCTSLSRRSRVEQSSLHEDDVMSCADQDTNPHAMLKQQPTIGKYEPQVNMASCHNSQCPYYN